MRRAVFLAGVALACSASPPTAPRPPESTGGRPSFDSVNAPWLEARSESWWSGSIYSADHEVVALGARVALIAASVGSQASVVALHEERGILGIVDVRDAYWVGVDGADAIYRVLEGGVFERASDAVAASSGDWEQRASVPDAGSFAAAGSVVAAAVRDAVYVSVDGAASFRRSVPRAGAEIEELYARHDGVLVAVVRRQSRREELFVSPDRGTRWARSSLQAGGIDQTGAWIHSRCAQAVLSADGKTWVEREWGVTFDTKPLSRAIEIGQEFVAYPRQELLNQTVPPAPSTKDERTIAGQHPCGDRSDARSAPRVRMGSPNPRGCEGVQCFRDRAHPFSYPTGTQIELFQDGLCAPVNGGENRECPLGHPLVRAPHALVIDRDAASARVVELPAGCLPMTVRSGGGISVLVCLDGQRSLFVADRSGTWHDESGLVVSESSTTNALQVANDGSVLFHDDLGDVRISHAWVRAPLPLGDPGAWRRLEYRDVAGYSVAPGGRALVVMSEHDTLDRFTLWLDELGHPPRKLAHLEAGGRRVHQVCVASGQVRFLLESSGRFEAHTLENGHLVLLGPLPHVSYDWPSAVQKNSALLCNGELALLKSGAERP